MSEANPLPAREAKTPWFDLISAILMAVASLGTAWCSFQNSRWSGHASDLQTREGMLERHCMEMTLESRQFETAHFQAAMKAIDALVTGNEKLYRFYTERFTDELKPAWEKWIALKPLENPDAPPHPFVPGFYTPRYQHEIHDANAAAAQAGTESRISSGNASGYLSNTVLLATVLFFAGTAGKFGERLLRRALLAFAVGVFVFAAVRMVMLPIA